MENLPIKFAIEFMNKIGYSWDGKIIGKEIPTTIEEFFYPVFVLLNNEEKAVIFYEEVDNLPECKIYKYKDDIFMIEKDLTAEWVEFLSENNIKF